jgi:ATP-dependent Clp protease ATP-binding subunit ClpC
MTLPDIRTEPELVALRRIAENLAAARRERVTSAHLLAAIASEVSVASELLAERRLSAEQLLRAARSSSDDERDPLVEAEQRARELAQRMRGPEPGALHLLVALLSVKGSAAYRVLDQFGVDVVRLRLLAMNIGLGHLQRRTTARANANQRAVTVPLTPKSLAIRPKANAADATPPAQLTLVKPPSPLSPVLLAVPQVPPGEQPSETNKDTKRPAKRAKKKDLNARFALDPKRFKLLSEIGYNWCERVARGELPEVVERQREVERMLDVLAKKDANNPCLVGLSGVGKTSLVQALAQRIVDQRGLAAFDERVLVEVRVSDLLSGTGVRGALAERIDTLRRELAAAAGRVVLIFDDVHQLFAPESSDECGAILRRALAEGTLPCIGISNPDAFARIIESEPSLARCFSRIDVEEPDAEVCETILLSAAEKLAEHHAITFQADVLQKAVTWSSRYITERALPDKAIGLLDLAGAKAHRRGGATVDAMQLAMVVSERSAVPVERLLETDGQRLLHLEQTLAERVVGHEEALAKISRIVRRNAAGLGGNRPIGSFLLLGPTGVGKTESAKALAFALFGSETAMTRLDLSEYSEAHAVARLIGSPPGYVGHEAGGQLTEAVRRRPYQVLLFDEVEKAHPEVLETFLPLLDEGRLTDGRGRTVNFTNTVILLTSNLGAREAVSSGSRRLGFGNEVSNHIAEEAVLEVAKRALAPEFYNRMDEVLVYKPLDRALVTEIARRLLQKLVDTVMSSRNVELRIDASIIDLLLAQGGFDSQMGARPMKRAIARLVEAPLAECLLKGDVPAVIDVGVESGSVVLSASSNALE